MSKKNYTLDPFQTWAHRWGRIGTLIALANRILNIMPGTTLMGMVGFLILAMLPVAIITSRIMWKKGVIKVVDKEEA